VRDVHSGMSCRGYQRRLTAFGCWYVSETVSLWAADFGRRPWCFARQRTALY